VKTERSFLKTFDLEWVLEKIPGHVREARLGFGVNDILTFFDIEDDGQTSNTLCLPRDLAAPALIHMYPGAIYCHRIIQGVYENPEHVVAVVSFRGMLCAVLVNIGDGPNTGVLN
jgi:hypothetical protein